MRKPLFSGPIPLLSTLATIAMAAAGVLRAGPDPGRRAAFAVASALLLAALAARWRASVRAPREAPRAPLAHLPGAASSALLLALSAIAPDGAALVALATIAASIGLGAIAPATLPETVEYGDGHPCM